MKNQFNYYLFGFINKHKIELLVVFDVFLMLLSFSLTIFLLWGNNLSVILVFCCRFWWIPPLIMVCRVVTFRLFGLYHLAWQYIGLKEIFSLLEATVICAVLAVVAIIVLGFHDFPLSVLMIEGLIFFVFISAGRLSMRILREIHVRLIFNGENRNILIVGAGDAGEMISREMLKLANLGYRPVGFVDDNPMLKGVFIHRLPVLGNCTQIPQLVKEKNVDEIIIAIPSAKRNEIRTIINYCEESKAKFKIVPGLFELIDGTVHVNQIREVKIEDLLGRVPVKFDIQEVSSYLSNVPVLITGAGGSIGAELCRQVASFNPSTLILLGKGENSIFEIEMELKKRFPYLTTLPCIADIRDKDRLNNIFKTENPAVVFHAAAHKHVLLMEKNIDEAVLNNIIGTKNIVDISAKYLVKKFVMISSDKAVNPSSVMGATKRIAEMIVQAKALAGSKTDFVSVRFGNVLESRGSVVPLFKKQIAEGGPVTITHPEVKRFFMTISEAVQLVIQAGAMGRGGEIFILDMGEPVKIIDLAKDLIRLSGLEVGIDIELAIIGLRPGEKLFEEILSADEGTQATKNKKIFIAPPIKVSTEKLFESIGILENQARMGETQTLKKMLFDIVSKKK